MKVHVIELPRWKNMALNTSIKLIILTVALISLTIIPLYLLNGLSPPWVQPAPGDDVGSKKFGKNCDMFRGQWVPYLSGTYYTNATCSQIFDQQNCLKFGRPDTEFLKWRWKPDDCEVPLFDPVQFLEIVRGKSMAFVGDSLGRNQFQSLLCLLERVVYPVDASYTADPRFKRWLYTDYNFTVASFWSPFLVKASDADPEGHSLNSLMNLYLDEADEAWAAQIETFDYVIVSAGHWFFRPLMLYENGQLVGCHACNEKNIRHLSKFDGHRMAFRTTFRTLQSLKNYKGVTILGTYSPAHFENGEWNKGGSCTRVRPFASGEMKVDGYNLGMYLSEVEELRAAEKEGKKRGLKFRQLDITEAMILRPDGHPNHYGHSRDENVTIADCVHWCLPGPIDTWNEFLLQMLKMEDRNR